MSIFHDEIMEKLALEDRYLVKVVNFLLHLVIIIVIPGINCFGQQTLVFLWVTYFDLLNDNDAIVLIAYKL